MEECNQAQRNASFSQCDEDWKVYRILRNKVTSVLKNEKIDWQRAKLGNCGGSPNEQWQLVKGWLGWKASGSPSQLFHEGHLISKPLEIADCLNQY